MTRASPTTSASTEVRGEAGGWTPGHWLLLTGWHDGPLNPEVVQLERATDKLVKYMTGGRRLRQSSKLNVLAVFADKTEAERIRDTIAGIRGERDRRVQAAKTAAREQVDALLAKARGQ